MPRLELTDATLALKVATHLRKELDIKVNKGMFWPDSWVVLSWTPKDALWQKVCGQLHPSNQKQFWCVTVLLHSIKWKPCTDDYRRGILEKWDPRSGIHRWGPGLRTPHKGDSGPQYDQEGLGIQDRLSGSRYPLPLMWDPGPLNFQVGPRTQDLWKGTLINNLLAWKIECCNESINILLEN